MITLKPIKRLITCLILLVMLFSFNMISSAAPGDTVSKVTDIRFPGITSSLYLYKDITYVIATFNRPSTATVSISGIEWSNGGEFRISSGGSGPTTGTLTVSFRKTDSNGTRIIAQYSITNPYRTSGRVSVNIPKDAIKSASILPGESIDILVRHNLDVTGYLYANTDEARFWKVDYWLTDFLIQQGVDNAAQARDAAIAGQASADTAAARAQNNYNILSDATKGLAKTFDVANSANSRTQTTINQTWYPGTYGGPSESVGDIAGYIRTTQLPALETKMNNLHVAVTNIQNSDTTPPTVDVQTVSGARATSASSIQAIVTVTDNRPGPYTYSINGGSYSTLPSDGRISLPVVNSGNNSITVNVKDVAGNVGSKTIIIRKL
ncbi:hypothetical protein N752_29685 [Desulforamulus aquiferis]|nr:hypothetical protein [Desulforamulus aquiferis]RYD01476.1 hypothetical protein N752_29685 [Desulforamulus aquiferis]